MLGLPGVDLGLWLGPIMRLLTGKQSQTQSLIHSFSKNQAGPPGLGLLLTCTGVAGILAYRHAQALRLSPHYHC